MKLDNPQFYKRKDASRFLLEYFPKECIVQDSYFLNFGYCLDAGQSIISYAETIHYLELALKNNSISALIINETLLPHIPKKCKIGIVVNHAPRKAFFNLYKNFLDDNLFIQDFKYGRGENIKIAPSSIVSKKCYIGNNCEIAENVVIKDNVYIGDNCFIDAGVIIGNEGVLYEECDGNINFIKHAGCVKIMNNVTILSNAVIVKSIFPNNPTFVDSNSIIGIATTIGHEANIGKNCKVLGNCVVAKSSSIGDGTIINSSCVIRENIKIGQNVIVKAGSIVVNNLNDNDIVSGNFAYNHIKQVKNFMKLKREKN